MFVESVDYGVLGAHVFITGQVTPDQQLILTLQNISPTLHSNFSDAQTCKFYNSTSSAYCMNVAKSYGDTV